MPTPDWFLPQQFFDLTQTDHASVFALDGPVWTVLKKIEPYLQAKRFEGYAPKLLGTPYIGEQVYFGEGVLVEHGAVIKGPAWIGRNSQIRAGAYLRENVIIGDDCVIGNSCEFKNALLFNGCQVPHYTYVGDSILGYKAHLGAGVILSNFKLKGDEIVLRHEGEIYHTGLRKFGAMVGDRAEIGCHAVLNPGSIIGRRALIYPGVVWRGILEEASIVKNKSEYIVLPSRG